MQTSKSIFLRLLAVLMIAGLVFGVLPAANVQAQTPAQTLNVANWTASTSVGVTGRPAVLKVGDTYHLWYGASDYDLYHSTSTDPAVFSAGSLTTYDQIPFEVASPAIIEEGGTFYMVYYSPTTNTVFSLYSSADGDVWTYIKDVFDCTGFTDYNKLDAAYVLKDGSTFRLYFQLKNAAKTSTKIYTAESTQTLTDPTFVFTLANGGNPVLVPGASGSWDSNFVMHPWVIKDNGVYYMYYSAYGTQQVIGMAKSDDGYNWTKSPANPILGPVGEPSVIIDNGTWHMWYLGSASAVKYFASTGPIEFTSIQTAISKANGGETISVAPGTYNEAVIINKMNITLESTAGANATTIDVPDGTLTKGVVISGTNLGVITVDGFTVKNFTEGGIIQGMASATGTTAHVLNNIVTPKADYLRNGIQVSGNGSTVIGNWIGGARLTDDWGSSGIVAVNNGNITIQDNILEGDGLGFDYGIEILNYSGTTMSNIQVLNNTISHADYAMDVSGYNGKTITDVNFEGNKVTNYVAGASTYVVTGTATFANIDFTHNWFGSAAGPSAVDMEIEFPFAPWCADETCTTFLPDANGEISIPSSFTADEIQLALNNAPEGTKIIFSGTVPSMDGGYQVNNTHLTIMLADGTIIQNDSPCFVVNADYTRITTESIGGAKCVPTNFSNGIDVTAGRVNVIIEGLEIDGTGQDTGDGIHFAGAITDVQVINNYIHDLDGNALTFTAIPVNTSDVQGNMFLNNTGVGVSAPADMNVAYNSWGSKDGASAGDGISGITTSSPFTHVDLSMTSLGSTPWENQVLPGYTITYTVKGNFDSALTADFKLYYPANLTVASTTMGSYFTSAANTPEVIDTSTVGTISFAGYATTPVSGDDLTLYTVTFTAATSGLGALDLDDAIDAFGMLPPSGPSTNIYAFRLVDGTINVISDFPTLTATGLDADFAATYPQEFSLTLTNPVAGVTYDTPQLQFTFPTGTTLEYWNGASWTTVSATLDLAALANDGVPQTLQFRVAFPASGSQPVSISLIDTDFPLATLATLSTTVTVNPNYTVAGTFSMQGRSVRSGIPVTLTMASALYGPFSGSTIDVISNNLSIANVAVASYTVTTSQPRYLNVTADLAQTVDVSGNTTLPVLELKGGNATDAGLSLNTIDVDDASAIGADWGLGITENGDVNFSGKVDIFDLAIAGGNFDLTSADVYSTWLP